MTNAHITAMKDHEKAAIIRRLFGLKDGKKVLQILKLHFDFHLPSAAVAGYDTNRTFYQDGIKAVFSEIDLILDGKWSEAPTDPDEEEEEADESQ